MECEYKWVISEKSFTDIWLKQDPVVSILPFAFQFLVLSLKQKGSVKYLECLLRSEEAFVALSGIDISYPGLSPWYAFFSFLHLGHF